MFRRFLPVWVILWSWGLAGPSARAQQPFPTKLIPSRTALERLGLERQWFVVVPMVETERLLRINRADTLVFALTSNARVHTFDSETGRRLWTAELGQRSGFASGVAANSWAVFATGANMLFALDRATGRPLWKVNLDTIPSSVPACDEKRVYVGMSSGMLRGYSLKRADSAGKESIRDVPYPLPSWHAGSAITTRPVLADNVMAFGGGDHKVHVVMIDEPTLVFRVTTGGPIGEGMGAYGARTLLIPSGDFNLYAVDVITSEMLWTFPSGAVIRQEPLVSDEDVYVINDAGNLSRLDPKTGKLQWTAPTQGGRLTAISASKIYLRSYNLDLFMIDRATGRTIVDPSETHLRAGLNLRDYDLSIVNRFDDRLFFATGSGLVVAVREAGQVSPRPLRDAKQPPFGYVPPQGIKPAYLRPAAAQPAAEPEPEPEPGAAGDEPAPAGDKDAAPKEAPANPPE